MSVVLTHNSLRLTIFSEEFTEYGISSSGRIENLYVEFNEEIELKMSVAHYTYVSIAWF
jgi:hypothetical protein